MLLLDELLQRARKDFNHIIEGNVVVTTILIAVPTVLTVRGCVVHPQKGELWNRLRGSPLQPVDDN